MLYKKFEKQFNKVYAGIISINQLVIDTRFEADKTQVKWEKDVSEWRNLEDDYELQLLLARLGYIDQNLSKDSRTVGDVGRVLEHKFSRRNCLVFLAQIEKLYQPWMGYPES